MRRRGSRRRRWGLLIVVFVVLGLSHWAWRIKPDSTLVATARARQTATLSAENPYETVHARIILDFRTGPAPARWVLHEGQHPGAGYELHWLPERLALRLVQVGDSVRILGTAFLAHGPRFVEFRRQGLRLMVMTDGRAVLNVIDALPTRPPRAWAWQAAADVGDVVLSLHDDRGTADQADACLVSGDHAALEALLRDTAYLNTPLHVLARLRLAILADPASVTAWENAQRDARSALRSLGDAHADAAGIDAWLAWCRVRAAVARIAAEPQGVSAAAELLAERAAVPGPASELPGLLLDQMVRLLTRASQRPARAVPVAEVMALQRRLLQAAERLGHAAIERESAALNTSDYEYWMLRLVVHAASALRGAPTQPTPADGPMWLAERWRAFAGRAPRSGHLPPTGAGWMERDPLAVAMEHLVAQARFEPVQALALTEQVRQYVDLDDDGRSALAVCESAPPEAARQAMFTRAILALHGIGSVEAARAVLQRPDGDGMPIAVDDPLGYALERLLASGLRRPGDRDELIMAGVMALPEPLRWAEPLLNGAASAPAEAWRLAPERPFEAIAAALIMQELVGSEADWALLEARPHFTVPLELIIPRVAQPAGERPTPPEPPAPILP